MYSFISRNGNNVSSFLRKAKVAEYKTVFAILRLLLLAPEIKILEKYLQRSFTLSKLISVAVIFQGS